MPGTVSIFYLIITITLKGRHYYYSHFTSKNTKAHIKNPPPMQETQVMRVQSLGQEEPLEAEMATDSRILAWEIPRTEELGRLQSMKAQRVGHN